MKKYIENFMKYKHLLAELVKKTIKLKYRRSYLGIFWTLLEPLLNMLVLTFVFGTLFNRSEKDPYFAVYILSGRLLYSFFAGSTRSAMRSIRVHSSMIKKVYIPKYIYPLAAAISEFVFFLISLIVLGGVAIVLRVPLSVYILQLIVPVFFLFILSIGVGLILATLAVFFRDLEYLWSIALTIIMYGSAIFYYPDNFIASGKDWIFNLNPLYAAIVNFRNGIYYNRPLQASTMTYLAVVSVLCLVVGIVAFKKNQDKFILHL